MALRLRTGVLAILFTIAMGLHFVLTDRGLRERYPRRFAHSGRVALAAALLVGWGLSALFAPTSTLIVALLTALLGGSVLRNVFKEAIPSDRELSFHGSSPGWHGRPSRRARRRPGLLSVASPSIEGMFDTTVVEAMAPGPELTALLLSVDHAELDEPQALTWLRASQRVEAHLEARRYDVLGRYAELNPLEADEHDPPMPMAREREVAPGGEGAPRVSEFAVGDLAVATACTSGRAYGQLGDALDLAHRMPRLFARLRAGEVSEYKVRMILHAAHSLSEMAARALDKRIAPIADKVGPTRLQAEIDKTLIEVDPAGTEERADAARATRRLHVRPTKDGDRMVFGYVDAFDGLCFDAALDLVADLLGDLGDTRCRDQRRAAAVGWLANPPATLALVQRHQAWRTGQEPEPWATSGPLNTVTDDDGTQHLRPGMWRLDVPTPADMIDPDLWPAATVVVHMDQQTWQTGDGPADLRGHGPITADQAFDRLRHHRVTIQPVVDLTDDLASRAPDGSDFTGALREAVLLANGWNPFPYADAHTRHDDDADHTIPRRLGGPTSLDNGGPLRRRLHRHKTFAKGWRVKQPSPASSAGNPPKAASTSSTGAATPTTLDRAVDGTVTLAAQRKTHEQRTRRCHGDGYSRPRTGRSAGRSG